MMIGTIVVSLMVYVLVLGASFSEEVSAHLSSFSIAKRVFWPITAVVFVAITLFWVLSLVASISGYMYEFLPHDTKIDNFVFGEGWSELSEAADDSQN